MKFSEWNGPISSIFSPESNQLHWMSNSSRIAKDGPTSSRSIDLGQYNSCHRRNFLKILCLHQAFWPVDASRAARFHAVHQVPRLIIRPIFQSSAMRLSLFCRRPLYQSSEHQCFSDRVPFHQKTTLAGFDFSGPVTPGTSTRRPLFCQLSYCSCTESICCNQHDFLAFLVCERWANFPIEVVLPTHWP